MNRTILALSIGTLLVSSAIGARSDRAGAPDPALSPSSSAGPGTADRIAADRIASGRIASDRIVLAQAAIQPNVQPPAPQAAQAPALPQDVYMQDQAAVARINAQIDALMAQPKGGFAVTYYAKPAPPPMPPTNPVAANQPPAAQQPPPAGVSRDRYGNAEKYVIARAGDTIYATIDRAFSSDDPQAPIFATIHDVDNVGIQGPLDNVRMVGNIKYSSSQGAIQFDKGYLPDGRPIEVKGIAISQDTARTGFAKDVDNHNFEKYGSLLIATLVQGVGQVGQVLTQNSQQAMVDPTTGLLVAQQKFNPYEAAAGALLPAGQALTAVAAQNFNKPATISAPAGFGLGIVFTEPVVVPADLLFARSR